MDGDKVVVAPAFHCAFPFEVNDHRTLFSLEGVVTARGNQAFNDMIKRVVVVVVEHHMPIPVQGDF